MENVQLIKKRRQGGYKDIFPRTFLNAIRDKESGVTLTEILQGFNMYFLSHTGSRESTRLQIPSFLRREGLWITYVLYDHTVITEWYNSEKIDDESWKSDSNWRVGSNALVGDISISSDGYWVINGIVSETKAQGEQGVTPLLRIGDNNKLQVSYNEGKQWNDISDLIVPKFRWLQGEGTTAGTVQISMDLGKTWSNLSNPISNNLRIKKYIGINESLPTSGVEEGTIYMKGPYYAEDDTLNDNPIYRMWVYAWKGNTLAWQDNGEFTSIAAGVVQETGNSETEVMSQKAVTEKLSELGLKKSKTFSLIQGEGHSSLLDRLSVNISANTQFSVYFETSLTNISDVIVFCKKASTREDIQLGGVAAGKYKTFKTDYDISELGIYIPSNYITSDGTFTFWVEHGWIHDVDRISIKKVYDTISNKEWDLGILKLSERVIPSGEEARIHTFTKGYFGPSQPVKVTLHGGKNIINGTIVGIAYHDFADSFKKQTSEYNGEPISFVAEIIDTYPLYVIAYNGDGKGTINIDVDFNYLGEIARNSKLIDEIKDIPYINTQNISFVSDPDMIPTIDLDNKTIDLGPDPILKIGDKTYTKSNFVSNHRAISLQDETESTAQYLYFNIETFSFYPKIYTYKPNSNEVALGGVRHYKDGSIAGNFIFDYTVKVFDVVNAHNPVETKLKLKQITRLSRDYHGELVNLKPLVLIQFSDIHSREDNLKRIMNYVNYYKANQGFKIDDIVCCGDVVGGHWGNDFEYWNRCNAGAVLQCVGNHDTAYYTESEGFDWTRYVGIDAYNRYFAPYIEQWGVIQPADAADVGKCYYYKDYTSSNVRLIILDCMSIQKDGDTEQLSWFTEVLADANSQGLTVSVVYHYTSIFEKIDCAFTNIATETLPNDIPGSLINIVDAFIKDGGLFACWITGHTHRDWFGTVVGTTGSKQAVLCIDTAAALQQSLFSDIERNAKDKSFDLFNVIGIDTYRHRISVFRVGADFDAAQRHIGSICYDYANYKLLANY